MAFIGATREDKTRLKTFQPFKSSKPNLPITPD
jgi:hypothetical protein